jgi:hypothetical protein
MNVRDSVNGALATTKNTYAQLGAPREVDSEFCLLVAMQAIANILDIEFAEIARQYALEAPFKMGDETS